MVLVTAAWWLGGRRVVGKLRGVAAAAGALEWSAMTWSAHFHLYLHFYWQHVALLLKIHLLILHTHTRAYTYTGIHTHATWLPGRHNAAYGQRQCLADCGSSWASARSRLSFFYFFTTPTSCCPPPHRCAAFDLQQLPHFHAHSLSIYLAAAGFLPPTPFHSHFISTFRSLSLHLIFFILLFFEAFEQYFDPHSHSQSLLMDWPPNILRRELKGQSAG